MSSPLRAIFIRYAFPHWRTLTVLAMLLSSGVGLELLNPQILRHFIDTARAGKDLGALTRMAVLFLVVALAVQIIVVVETYVAENLGWIATNRLRSDLALHALRLDPAFHNAHTPGELIERIDGDVTTLSNFFSRFVVQLVANGVLLLGVLALLWLVDWRLGSVMLGFTVISVLVIRSMRRLAVPSWDRSRQASAELMGFLEERLAGTEDIRANGAVEYTMRRFYDHARIWYRSSLRAAVLGMTYAGTTTLLLSVGTTIALGMGAYLYRQGVATIGTVYLIFNYTQMLARPIEQLTRHLQDFQQAAAGIARVQHILSLRSVLVDGPEERLPRGPLPVEFDHVTFAYDADDVALDDLSFRLQPGKILGLLGRTGSGKTTISRLLFRLHDPTSGSVRLAGIDLRSLQLQAARSGVGMVTQEIQLFHATVRDNLTIFDRSVSDARIEQVLRGLNLWEWCTSLPAGLHTLLSGGATGLSAGEAQLLAFARVFLQDPGLVILDEASSRLDPATEIRIERAVDRLLKGRTGIVIAHRLGTVRRADDILILEGGCILEYGSRERLLRDHDSHFARMLSAGIEEVLA